MIAAADVQVVATYAAYVVGGTFAAWGIWWEGRNELRLWRRRREATQRAQARRDRIVVERYTTGGHR